MTKAKKKHASPKHKSSPQQTAPIPPKIIISVLPFNPQWKMYISKCWLLLSTSHNLLSLWGLGFSPGCCSQAADGQSSFLPHSWNYQKETLDTIHLTWFTTYYQDFLLPLPHLFFPSPWPLMNDYTTFHQPIFKLTNSNDNKTTINKPSACVVMQF